MSMAASVVHAVVRAGVNQRFHGSVRTYEALDLEGRVLASFDPKVAARARDPGHRGVELAGHQPAGSEASRVDPRPDGASVN
jgi:hypothetical protein